MGHGGLRLVQPNRGLPRPAHAHPAARVFADTKGKGWGLGPGWLQCRLLLVCCAGWLERCLRRQVYEAAEMQKAKLQLLSQTNMVDFALDTHKSLFPDQPAPAGWIFSCALVLVVSACFLPPIHLCTTFASVPWKQD